MKPNFDYHVDEDGKYSIGGSAYSQICLDESVGDCGLWSDPIFHYTVGFEDERWIAIGNHRLGELTNHYYPNIFSEAESGGFWGIADTEAEARIVVETLNDPELVVEMFRAMARNGYRIVIDGESYNVDEGFYFEM